MFWFVVVFSALFVFFTGDATAATCAKTNVDGFLYLATDSLADCSGHVLMDSTEYSQVPTLQALFAWPDHSQMAAAFMAGFALPMTFYLVAYGFGVVVNFFNPRNEGY